MAKTGTKLRTKVLHSRIISPISASNCSSGLQANRKEARITAISTCLPTCMLAQSAVIALASAASTSTAASW